MTREAQASKDLYRLNGGLNTEINELNFPDGFSTDEANYELLVDGSRRRRKGLDTETGGSAKTVATVTSTQVHGSFNWKSVDADPDVNFIVHQVGSILYFTDDAETISTTYKAFEVDLEQYKVATATTAASIANAPCQFATGRGHLFVTHPLLKPFYCEFDGTDFQENALKILIRDYEDIEDGIGITIKPTDATITADHAYNLLNRGWREADYLAYDSAKGYWPAKNAIWHKGYKRVYDGSTAASLINPGDGIQTWDSDKMDAEVFGNASAPIGSFLIDPLDTTYAYTVSDGAAGIFQISTWSDTNLFTTGKITFTTTTNHNLTGGETVLLTGLLSTYLTGPTVVVDATWTGHNGSFLVDAGASGTTFTVSGVIAPINFGSWLSQYETLGYLGGEATAKSTGKTLTVGPSACEYYAGRVFYGGIQDTEWADTVFFSQIASKPEQYALCHAKQDPTNQDFNALLPDDGGYMVIPGLGGVKDMVTVRNSLLILSENGVWEVSGGNREGFTALNYIVKKLTDAEVTSSWGSVKVDNDLCFVSTRGIFFIAPNQYTGLLEAQNISAQTIQTLWNAVPTANQNVAKVEYDDAVRRIYVAYGDTGDRINQYANALIFDLKAGGWFKYTFTVSATEGIVDIYTITDSDSSDSNKKMKWTVMGSATTLKTCDLDQTDFDDYNGSNGPTPYIVFGHDNIGSFQSRRQAPIITVFSKRTETGYVDNGTGWDPTNESSTLMSAYWDWTNDAVSNKITTAQEVYRHVRQFVPSGASDVDGYPVVVTRNKVRGRGRSLQLRFDGATDKDSHILGYTTNYKISRRK